MSDLNTVGPDPLEHNPSKPDQTIQPELKQRLRKQLTQQRQNLTDIERATFSKKICANLIEYLEDSSISELLLYKSMLYEVDTGSLFSQFKMKKFVPRMLDENQMEWVRVDKHTHWEAGKFDIQEPQNGKLWQASDEKSVLLCPLLGFDTNGNRLGMGKGFFDRWLEKHNNQVEAIGLAFSCQELPKVPIEKHDAPLAKIITERGVVSCLSK